MTSEREGFVTQKTKIASVNSLCEIHSYSKWNISSHKWGAPYIQKDDPSKENTLTQLRKNLGTEEEIKDVNKRHNF